MTTTTSQDHDVTHTSLSVWTFGTPEGASEAAERLQDITDRRPAFRPDAAVVWWHAEAPKPQGRQLVLQPGPGGLDTPFWDLLFGLVFSVPLLGAALGAARGAIPGALSEAGVSDTFVNRVRDEVTPGTSALFVVSSDEVVDAVRDALDGHNPDTLVSAPMLDEQEAALRRVFSEE